MAIMTSLAETLWSLDYIYYGDNSGDLRRLRSIIIIIFQDPTRILRSSGPLPQIVLVSSPLECLRVARQQMNSDNLQLVNIDHKLTWKLTTAKYYWLQSAFSSFSRQCCLYLHTTGET